MKFRLLFSIFVLILVAGISTVFAQPATPPLEGTGVAAPLTMGPEPQIKRGDLTVEGGLGLNNLCFGADCRNVWPDDEIEVMTETVVDSNGATCQTPSYLQTKSYYFFDQNGDIQLASGRFKACDAAFVVTFDELPGLPLSFLLKDKKHGIKCWHTDRQFAVPAEIWTIPPSFSKQVRLTSDGIQVSGTCTLLVQQESDGQEAFGGVEAEIDVRYLF